MVTSQKITAHSFKLSTKQAITGKFSYSSRLFKKVDPYSKEANFYHPLSDIVVFVRFKLSSQFGIVGNIKGYGSVVVLLAKRYDKYAIKLYFGMSLFLFVLFLLKYYFYLIFYSSWFPGILGTK